MSAPSLPSLLTALEADFPSRLIAVGAGASVSVRRCGRRRDLRPVVLAHGISSSAASWLQVATLLREHTEVIAWDAPGYGASTPLAVSDPLDEDYGRRLVALLDALGLHDALLVGHSLGALMVLACARQTATGPAVLISPARGYGRADQAAQRARVQADRLDALQQLGVQGLAERIDQRLLSPQADESARSWLRWSAAQMNAAGYRQAVHTLCHSQLARGVSRDLAIEVHCGDADVVTTPQDCALWAQQNGAPFHLIAGAGHASPVEQPEAVARLVLQALQTHKAAAVQEERHD